MGNEQNNQTVNIGQSSGLIVSVDASDCEVEEYIRNLKWSDNAKDMDKTLVGGNIRGFWAWLKEQKHTNIHGQPPPFRSAVVVDIF